MIKKIYDRDTGNIYDVGADNKLKLVAEGTYNPTSDYEGEIVLNNNLEPNKIYMVSINDNVSTLLCSNTIISTFGLSENTGIPTFISMIDGDTESLQNFLSHILYSSRNKININGDGSTYVFGESIPVKIYELPFSM